MPYSSSRPALAIVAVVETVSALVSMDERTIRLLIVMVASSLFAALAFSTISGEFRRDNDDNELVEKADVLLTTARTARARDDTFIACNNRSLISNAMEPTS